LFSNRWEKSDGNYCKNSPFCSIHISATASIKNYDELWETLSQTEGKAGDHQNECKGNLAEYRKLRLNPATNQSSIKVLTPDRKGGGKWTGNG
jgi:hypothetical protein